MKKTGYRLISFVGIVLAIGGIAWGVMSFSRIDLKFDKIFVGGFKGQALSIPVTDSSDFSVTGIWDLAIVQGPPSLKVYATADDIAKLAILNEAGKLSLSMGSTGFGIGRVIRAELSMPNLRSLTTQGGTHIDVSKLVAKIFVVKTDGASSIVIRDSAISDMSLTCNGASSVDAGSSRINNAVVNMEGAGNVNLGMNGGTLQGSIRGVGHLSYTGIVTSETVKTEGLAKVERK